LSESVDEQLEVVSGERSPIGVMDFGNIDIDGVIPVEIKTLQQWDVSPIGSLNGLTMAR